MELWGARGFLLRSGVPCYHPAGVWSGYGARSGAKLVCRRLIDPIQCGWGQAEAAGSAHVSGRTWQTSIPVWLAYAPVWVPGLSCAPLESLSGI